MNDFSFVSDDALRRMIERDKKEIDDSLAAGLNKCVLVLAGSLIEAILVDYFLAFPIQKVSKANILKAQLNDLVDWAADENLISQRTKEISTVIRTYRNLIHPGKEYRLKERVDIHSATVAAHLVEIISEEIRENYSQKIGYKAETAIEKIKSDSSSIFMIQPMVAKMSLTERIKLFRNIPGVCKENHFLPETINTFSELHTLLSGNIPQSVVQEETIRITDFLKHENTSETFLYLRFFMRHLNLLNESERKVIIEYMINLFSVGEEDVLLLFRSIPLNLFGGFLEEEQRELLSKSIFRRLHKTGSDLDIFFLSILENIFMAFPDEYKDSLKKDLNRSRSPRAKQWAVAIDGFIPF